MNKKSYQTEQKRMILAFLSENQGHHVTVGMIQAHTKEKGCSVGLATIYRNLDKFVDNGMVLKYNLPEEACSYYQFLGQPFKRSEYYFLICVKCGRIIPLPYSHINSFFTYIQEQQHFRLDNTKTILYGYCKKCNATNRIG